MPDENKESAYQDVSQLLGLNTLSLLGANSSDIEVVTPWHQGGAETYVADFLLTKGGDVQHLIAKACIKFGPREAMNEWLGRRKMLQENGVCFPELVLVDGATIVEEYIPYSFAEAFHSANANEQNSLRLAFVNTYKRIVGAGFTPMSVHDIRSRGSDAIVIDVGEDLGAPSTITECNLSIVVDAERHFRNIIK
jgi:hypothetical protein